MTLGELKEVEAAMKALGYKPDPIELEMLDDVRAKVIYSGDQIGIYDFVKHTFVD